MGGFLLFRVGFRAWRTFCWMKRWLIRMMCGFLGFRSWDFQVFRTLGLEILGLGGWGVLWFWGFSFRFGFVVSWFVVVCGFRFWFVVWFPVCVCVCGFGLWICKVLIFGFGSLTAYCCLCGFWLLMVALSFWGWNFFESWICLYVWIMLEWLRSFPYFVAVVYILTSCRVFERPGYFAVIRAGFCLLFVVCPSPTLYTIKPLRGIYMNNIHKESRYNKYGGVSAVLYCRIERRSSMKITLRRKKFADILNC